MGEEPTRVARSVAAGCLLNHFASTKPLFIPIVSEIMVAYLNRYGLISPFEKDALMKAAGDDYEDPKEKMILAIENALLSIEKDTGGVTCYLAHRVYAMSIRDDILIKEILPILRFQDLSISATYVPEDNEEYQRKKVENMRLLGSYQIGNEVKWKLASTSTPTRNRTRIQRR